MLKFVSFLRSLMLAKLNEFNKLQLILNIVWEVCLGGIVGRMEEV